MRKTSIFSFILFTFVLLALSISGGYASGTHEGGHGPKESTTSVEKSINSKAESDGHGSGTSKDPHKEKETKHAQHNSKERSKKAEHMDHSKDSDQSGLLQYLLPGLTKVPDIHPMMVHFPIVLLWTSLLFVGTSWFWKPDKFLTTARWMFWLGLIALPITAGTGFLAVGGWGGGHVTIHRNLMLITVGLAFLLFGILYFIPDRQQLYRIVMTVGLVIIVVFMTLGADRGAWLVYVKGSGVKPAENVHKH
jgi:uncharacterized membrane protein